MYGYSVRNKSTKEQTKQTSMDSSDEEEKIDLKLSKKVSFEKGKFQKTASAKELEPTKKSVKKSIKIPDTDSEDEVEVAPKKTKTASTKKAVKVSDSEEEIVPKKSPKTKSVKVSDSEEEIVPKKSPKTKSVKVSDSEEEIVPKKSPKTKTVKVSDSEEEIVPKKSPKTKTLSAKKSVKVSDSEEEVAPKKTTKTKKSSITESDSEAEEQYKLDLSDDDMIFGSMNNPIASTSKDTKKISTKSQKLILKSGMKIDVLHYDFKNWSDYFLDGKVDLLDLLTNKSWHPFFLPEKSKPYFKNIEKILSGIIINEPNKTIVPYPELIFFAENNLDLTDIKVVILGQDPYIGARKFNNKEIPQAMGLSFSAPEGFPIPDSLLNIYKNLLDFGHIKKLPTSPYLIPWLEQGVFLINSSFTTFLGTSNCHQQVWNNFSDSLLKYINDNTKNLVFLIWGKSAYNKVRLINKKRHHLIISSHPSPLSCNNSMTGLNADQKPETFPAFMKTDHFGRTNKFLKEDGLEPIDWNIR